MNPLQKLLSIGSDALGDSRPIAATFTALGQRGSELLAVLEERNGFFAFESALLVRPSGLSKRVRSLESWNAPGLWRDSYEGTPLQAGFFFAEDAFGGQFALAPSGVSSVNPETGEGQLVAADLEEWAEIVLKDPAYMTGHPLAHAWQEQHGPLAPDQRLVPATPFVLGGEYALENLVAYDALLGMRVRGGLARQIVDVPDGSSIVFRLENRP